ncbi:MAG: PAS domain-containing protein [Herpetosiphonaceae bacterium]|nr:PAS domain-containing protein [Herpetosiphonaceae bacterium]
MTTSHLQTLHWITRSLAGDEPLAERLHTMLVKLRASLPYAEARVIVLQTPAWSYCLPNQRTPSWAAHWTEEMLAARAPVTRSAGQQQHYLGWPICQDEELLGAVELWVVTEELDQSCIPLLDALVPLLAMTIQAEATRGLSQTTSQLAALQELQEQLDAPCLLAPLALTVTEWVQTHCAAQQALLHVIQDGRSSLLSFVGAAYDQVDTVATTTVLAHSAMHHSTALMHRNGNGLECALPLRVGRETVGALVVIGRGLRRESGELLYAAATLIGPALRRAVVYQQMADKEQQLARILSNLPTGLALTDREGLLLQSNPAWAHLWGVPETTIQGGQLVPWDMFEPLLPRLPDPIAFDQFFRHTEGAVWDATLQLQEPYQLLRILRIPLLDALGQRSLTLFVLTDITREREAERAKTEFVSVVSHELRTPLTSILGYTELLRARDFAPAERFELLDTVWRQATHLSSLVEDLLNVSRIDAGRITLSRWVLSLRQLVTELIAQMNKQLDHRHQLLLDIPAQLPPVYADRDRVRQILSNLLSNAIKYSPDGGEIVLRAEVLSTPPPSAPALPPEPALLITVRDPGIGIDPAEQQRIFERFYRVDNSNTRRIGGSGLGLSITKALVELHGGRLWVSSEAGEGSTFAFTLPLASDVVHTTNGYL